MHFKHPELLYFLFLLIIPILVHLFQLRRFKTEYFTNVSFLRSITIQTRKSAKIKKWLLLFNRLLILLFLILAFAQPYFDAKEQNNISNELFVILDNSFSMQAKGQNGPLLKRAVQEILENTPENKNLSILTNNNDFWNTDIQSVEKDLQNIKYSSESFNLEKALAKIKSKNSVSKKDILIVTDAKSIKETDLKNIDSINNYYFVIPEAEHKNNVAIDTVYIEKNSTDFYEIIIKISKSGTIKNDIPVSIINNNKLIAKALYKIDSKSKSIKFTIPKSEFNGYVSINDGGLEYDNEYYFSIGTPKKTKVLCIGNQKKSSFLNRIYTNDEFIYNETEISKLDYNTIEKQDVIVLNELENIPQALQTTLKNFVQKGGNAILIPNSNCKTENINAFVENFGKIKFDNLQSNSKLITGISFQHPIFQGVFENKITNFQFPDTKTSFPINSNGTPILRYNNQAPFLIGYKNKIDGWFFTFDAPINHSNSNFQNSPLIVPVFYRMAQINKTELLNAICIGKNQSIQVPIQLSKDEILSIKNEKEQFIPIQKLVDNKVKLTFSEMPQNAGNFHIYNKKTKIENISFNYDRTEGNLNDETIKQIENYEIIDSISTVYDKLHTNRTENEFWKWFIIFTLIFIISEILIQKFVK